MSNRTQCEQLLKKIDAVLADCSWPTARPTARPVRPAWRGPSWLGDQRSVRGHPVTRSSDPRA